jgi:hypothetical protein
MVAAGAITSVDSGGVQQGEGAYPKRVKAFIVGAKNLSHPCQQSIGGIQ